MLFIWIILILNIIVTQKYKVVRIILHYIPAAMMAMEIRTKALTLATILAIVYVQMYYN